MSIINFIMQSSVGPWLFYGIMIFLTYVLCQVIARKQNWIDYDEEADAKCCCFCAGILWPLTLIGIAIATSVFIVIRLGDRAVNFILNLF